LGAILSAGSRAGLVGAVAAVLVVGMVRARARETRGPALALWGALLVLAALASGSALSARFRFWRDADWYRSSIEPSGGAGGRLPAVLAPSTATTEALDVANLGTFRWRRTPPNPVRLSYHWLDARSGGLVLFEGARTELPVDVDPGGRVTLQAKLRTPPWPGRFILWWDLVHEDTSWFSERGERGLREVVVVRAAGAPSEGEIPLSAARGAGAVELPRARLWRAALLAFRAHPLLGLGPDNFRHLFGQFLGLASVDERLHANSLYFETLASLGAAGLLAFAWVVLALARAARRAWGAPEARTLALGLAAGLATYLLHGLLDYFFEFTPTYALFWLLAGGLVALGRPEQAPAKGTAA
jgi:hypothetical protein